MLARGIICECLEHLLDSPQPEDVVRTLDVNLASDRALTLFDPVLTIAVKSVSLFTTGMRVFVADQRGGQARRSRRR